MAFKAFPPGGSLDFQGQRGEGTGSGHDHAPNNTSCQNCFKPIDKFPKLSIFKGDSIGTPGAFGSVIRGQLSNPFSLKEPAIPVVIKMLHGTIGQKRYNYLQEMFNLDHRNLIKFIGLVNTDPEDCPQLIFRVASDGNLLDFVKDSNKNNVNAATLNKICLDIVHGMEYLHNMNFIHGCLAARNILLDNSNGHINAKVSDYGMNRVIAGVGVNYFGYVSGQSIPIRWLPKECMPLKKGNPEVIKASDVWAFGVCMWEMWTQGDVPYGAYGTVSNLEVKQFILNGSSPLAFRRPENCGELVLNIMKNIFNIDPHQRPPFESLDQLFQLETRSSTSQPSLLSSSKTEIQKPNISHLLDHPNDNPPSRGHDARGRGRGGGSRGRGNTRGARGGGGYRTWDNFDNNYRRENEGTNNYDRGGDHHRRNAQDDNVREALDAKREEFKAHKPWDNGHAVRGGRQDFNSRNDAKPRPSKVQHGQDPKNLPRVFVPSNNSESGRRGRGGGLKKNFHPGFRDSGRPTQNQPQRPHNQGQVTPGTAHEQQIDPYNDFQEAPPPYSEIQASAPLPLFCKPLLRGLRDSANRETKQLEKTVQELEDRVKSMQIQQEREKKEFAEAELKQRSAAKDRREQTREVITEMKRQQVEVQSVEKLASIAFQKAKQEEEEKMKQKYQAELEAENKRRKAEEMQKLQAKREQEMRAAAEETRRKKVLAALESDRKQRELEEIRRRKEQVITDASEAKRLQEEMDSLEAKRLQNKWNEWESNQQQEKLAAIELDEKKKQERLLAAQKAQPNYRDVPLRHNVQEIVPEQQARGLYPNIERRRENQDELYNIGRANAFAQAGDRNIRPANYRFDNPPQPIQQPPRNQNAPAPRMQENEKKNDCVVM